jgi:hypothetical protein
MNVRVTLITNPNGPMAKLTRALDGQGRISLHAAMGTEVQIDTAAHVGGLHRKDGSLLSKLGAAPTGFFQQASLQIESPAALASDVNAATLTLSFPGVKRAFQSIVVRPLTAKYLAIPIANIALGHSPRDCWEEWGLFITADKAKNQLYVARRDGGKIEMLWVLKRSLTQSQDRALLPSDSDWQKSAARGALNYIRSLPAN